MKNKYKRGKIYTIRNYIDNEIYVGSTIQPLHKRWYKHKSKCESRQPNMKLYHHMRNIGIDNFYIELHEEHICENVQQLRRREGQVMRELKSSLNQVIAGRTKQEYSREYYEKIN